MMIPILHISTQALFGQLLLGLINGAFYALLSLGLAVIFGMLNVVNFAHGALYMVGAFVRLFPAQPRGIGYWWALLLAPIIVGAVRRRASNGPCCNGSTGLDHLYGLLLTFGLALIIEGVFQNYFGSSGLPYAIPPELQGGSNLGFMFLPNYRGWVVVFSLVDLPRHLVSDRKDQARRLSARGDRKPDAGAGLRHQRAAA